MKTIEIKNNNRVIPAVVSVPKGSGPFPAVVINHGHGGNKEEHGGFIKLMESLNQEGILSVSIDFPGCGESTRPFTENYLSNMISDSNESLKYITDNYDIDLENLGILGYSMGGRITTTIVSEKNNPYKAIALLAPSVDDGEDLMASLVGGKDKYIEFKEELLNSDSDSFPDPIYEDRRLSKNWVIEMSESYPLKNIEKFKGDMVIIHGDKDTVVDLSISENLVKAYPKGDIDLIEGADHSFDFHEESSEILQEVITKVTSFFTGNLK